MPDSEATITFPGAVKWMAGLTATLFAASVIGSASYIRGMDTGMRVIEARVVKLETEQESFKADMAGLRRVVERIDSKMDRLLERRP